jgi:DEAD/DEAH box helicase domain-containing protein
LVILFGAGAAAEHVAQITGLEAQSLHVVSEDGSPRGEKLFVLWNPPVKPYRGKFWRYAGKKKQIEKEDGGSSRDKEASATGPDKRSAAEAAAAAAADGGRGDVVGKASLQQKEQEAGEDEDEDVPKRFSSISEVAYLLAELVRHDIRTIAFCTTRKLSELVLQYALESLSNSGHARLCGSIKSYRGGYTPEQRRSIEAELFGDILRVSSAEFSPQHSLATCPCLP